MAWQRCILAVTRVHEVHAEVQVSPQIHSNLEPQIHSHGRRLLGSLRVHALNQRPDVVIHLSPEQMAQAPDAAAVAVCRCLPRGPCGPQRRRRLNPRRPSSAQPCAPRGPVYMSHARLMSCDADPADSCVVYCFTCLLVVSTHSVRSQRLLPTPLGNPMCSSAVL